MRARPRVAKPLRHSSASVVAVEAVVTVVECWDWDWEDVKGENEKEVVNIYWPVKCMVPS